jgi:hypothetical protein
MIRFSFALKLAAIVGVPVDEGGGEFILGVCVGKSLVIEMTPFVVNISG